MNEWMGGWVDGLKQSKTYLSFTILNKKKEMYNQHGRCGVDHNCGRNQGQGGGKHQAVTPLTNKLAKRDTIPMDLEQVFLWLGQQLEQHRETNY